MKTAVGIYTSHKDAERAVSDLQLHNIPEENINLLIPGASQEEVEAVPTTEGEQPGMGKTLGGVVGGTAGFVGGMPLATAASLFIPATGPVVAIGLVAGAILSVVGAAAGSAAGEKLEDLLTKGVTKSELFVYEDALRQGRTVLITTVEDEAMADIARGIFVQTGAENIDSAREKWWLGLRDVEKEEYNAHGGNFTTDEPAYRQGFEAALHPERKGKSYLEELESLRKKKPEICETAAFRRGYERGKAYHEGLMKKYQ